MKQPARQVPEVITGRPFRLLEFFEGRKIDYAREETGEKSYFTSKERK